MTWMTLPWKQTTIVALALTRSIVANVVFGLDYLKTRVMIKRRVSESTGRNLASFRTSLRMTVLN